MTNKHFCMNLNIIDCGIYISEKAAEIAYENNYEKRIFLYEEYKDLEDLLRLYQQQSEDGKNGFDWKYCLKKGYYSLQSLGHFKDSILKDGVTEEEWKKEVEKSYKYMGEEKVKKYIEEYEKYRIRHSKTV